MLLSTHISRPGCDKRSVFKRSLTGLNSEIFFSLISCHTKVKEPSFPYYLNIGGRIVGLMPFTRVLVLREMQTAHSGFELESPNPFSKTIIVTLGAPPKSQFVLIC